MSFTEHSTPGVTPHLMVRSETWVGQQLEWLLLKGVLGTCILFSSNLWARVLQGLVQSPYHSDSPIPLLFSHELNCIG